MNKYGEGNCKTHLNAFFNADVILVGGIVLVSDDPVVTSEFAALLEYTSHLCEGDYSVGRVASGFDLIGAFEVIVRPRKLLEVTFNSRTNNPKHFNFHSA